MPGTSSAVRSRGDSMRGRGAMAFVDRGLGECGLGDEGLAFDMGSASTVGVFLSMKARTLPASASLGCCDLQDCPSFHNRRESPVDTTPVIVVLATVFSQTTCVCGPEAFRD